MGNAVSQGTGILNKGIGETIPHVAPRNASHIAHGEHVKLVAAQIGDVMIGETSERSMLHSEDRGPHEDVEVIREFALSTVGKAVARARV